MPNETIEKLLNKAYFFLSLRQRSEKEMYRYLKRKAEGCSATDEEVGQVMEELRSQKYLNDDAFVEAYVRHQSAIKPKGEYAIRLELRKKGIPEAKIDLYFQQNSVDEEMLAKDALAKVWSRYKTLPFLKRKKRAIDFLSRRGFTFDTANQAVEYMEAKTK